MTTFNPTVGTRTSLAYNGTDLSTLASGTYVRNTTAYNCSTNDPMDVIVEVDVATTNTPGASSNKRVVVYISESLDGTNFRSGPTSGTTTTRSVNLRTLGIVPVTTTSTTEIGSFSVLNALGFIPYSFYIIIFNDLGAALTSGTVYTAEIAGVAA